MSYTTKILYEDSKYMICIRDYSNEYHIHYSDLLSETPAECLQEVLSDSLMYNLSWYVLERATVDIILDNKNGKICLRPHMIES